MRVSWEPAAPVQGTLFWLRVASDEATGPMVVEGEVAGEPLHFALRFDSASAYLYEALAVAPIDAGSTLEIVLSVSYGSARSEVVPVHVPVSPGSYRLEQLTVAPEFGSPPDSAAQARLARDRAKAREVSRQAHRTARLWEETLMRPRDSRVTSGFGHGREFNGQVQSRHMGTDLQGLPGDPVRAAARGVVALVDAFYLAGNVVYLDHGGGLVSGYFHLSRAEVAEGDTVQAGQVIGRVGATGRVTGPHLHWVVRYGSVSVDPLSLLELAR